MLNYLPKAKKYRFFLRITQEMSVFIPRPFNFICNSYNEKAEIFQYNIFLNKVIMTLTVTLATPTSVLWIKETAKSSFMGF